LNTDELAPLLDKASVAVDAASYQAVGATKAADQVLTRSRDVWSQAEEAVKASSVATRAAEEAVKASSAATRAAEEAVKAASAATRAAEAAMTSFQAALAEAEAAAKAADQCTTELHLADEALTQIRSQLPAGGARVRGPAFRVSPRAALRRTSAGSERSRRIRGQGRGPGHLPRQVFHHVVLRLVSFRPGRSREVREVRVGGKWLGGRLQTFFQV